MRNYKKLEEMHPLDRIRELLYPSDETYCAELIDIEDAKWLLKEFDNFTGYKNGLDYEILKNASRQR